MNHQPHDNYNPPFYGTSAAQQFDQLAAHISDSNRTLSDSHSRSPPGSSRSYGTIGGTAQSRRGLDAISRGFQTPMHHYSDDSIRLGPFSSDRMDQGGNMANALYALDNNMQNWAHNAATVNGPMNGANRFRNTGRRALPSSWTNAPADINQPAHLFGAMGGPGPMNMNAQGMHGAMGIDGYGTVDVIAQQPNIEQIIPTALVIKNIPFNVRKEYLADHMMNLGLPIPYAFNYHFDNGIFRGLAFANFQTPEETAQVISAMNGMEVKGRKLRVEYKRQLPEKERERIEREKREKRGQLQEQHQPLTMQPQSSLPPLNASLAGNPIVKSNHLRDIDMNDLETLEFYTELTLFKSDNTREVFIFPAGLTADQRRKIHVLAHHLGLNHQSIGVDSNRQIHIYKRNQISPITTLPTVTYDSSRRGLSRAATIDFAESRVAASGNTSFHPLSRPGPTLELPGSPDANGNAAINNLRAAKSFADLRSFSPSPSLSTGSAHPTNMPSLGVARYGEYSTNLGPPGAAAPSTPGTTSNPTPNSTSEPTLVNLMDTMHLSGSYEAAGQGLSRPRESHNPGTIGSQRPGASGPGKVASSRPESEWPTNTFPARRANGHMPRGSDSSDNTRDSRQGGTRMY